MQTERKECCTKYDAPIVSGSWFSSALICRVKIGPLKRMNFDNLKNQMAHPELPHLVRHHVVKAKFH